jgi:DoxX-like family
MLNPTVIAQLAIAFSVLFVWIFRLENIKKEFVEYRLPTTVRNLVGATKISLAALLIAGVWFPGLVFGSAALMAFLMLCAIIAHVVVRHPVIRSVPALTLLVLSVYVAMSAKGVAPR